MTVSALEAGKGEIWLARLDPVLGHEQGGERGGERPCLIISDDRFNRSRAQLVIVLPITRTDRAIASHVRVEPPDGGLKALSFVKCEDVHSISHQRLFSRWGKVGSNVLAEVEDRLRILMRL